MLPVDGGGGGGLFLTSFKKKNLPQEDLTGTWHPQMNI